MCLEIFRNALSLHKRNSDEQESYPYDFGRLGKIT